MAGSPQTTVAGWPGRLAGVALLPVALGLMLGIAGDDRWCVDPRAAAGLFVVAGGLLFVPGRGVGWSATWLAVAAMGLGAAVHHRAVRFEPASGIARWATPEGSFARVQGTIATPPRVVISSGSAFKFWMHRTQRSVFLLDTDTIESEAGPVPCTGRVRVSLSEPMLNLAQGERVELFGTLTALSPPRNPGGFDWARYNRRQGIVARFWVDEQENVHRLPGSRPSRVGRWIEAGRQHVRSLLTDDLATASRAEVSLLQAMLLGHRSQVDQRLNDVFIRAGCMHFLAVSGTHVAIVLGLAWLGCRLLRVAGRRGVAVLAVVVVAYVCLAEPRPPILRAGVMALLLLGALWTGRLTEQVNSLAAAATLLLLIQPAWLFDVGFQLSFAAVLGICHLTRSLTDLSRAWFPPGRSVLGGAEPSDTDVAPTPAGVRTAGRWAGRTLRWLGDLFAVGLGAFLPTLPIIAWHFGRLCPWGMVNSVIVFPLVMLVMGVGMVKLALSAISPTVGGLLNWPLLAVDRLLLWTVDALGQLPGSLVNVPTPTAAVIIAYYALLVGATMLLREWVAARKRLPLGGMAPPRISPPALLWWHRLTAASLVLFTLAVAAWLWPRSTGGELRITALAVGAGLATVIELPDGSTVLYDAGTQGNYDVGSAVVVPYLRHRGIKTVERVYISHPNLDHFSGLPSIVDRIPTGPVYVNAAFETLSGPRTASRHLLDELAARGHPVLVLPPQREAWTQGGVQFERLWPPPDVGVLDGNDASTVLRLSYAGHSVLLTGDIEQPAQEGLAQLASAGEIDLHADVLVLPHHGSTSSYAEDFYAAVGAKLAVRSSNRPTALDGPAVQALAGGCPVLNTDDVGAVTVVIGPAGLRASGYCSVSQ